MAPVMMMTTNRAVMVALMLYSTIIATAVVPEPPKPDDELDDELPCEVALVALLIARMAEASWMRVAGRVPALARSIFSTLRDSDVLAIEYTGVASELFAPDSPLLYAQYLLERLNTITPGTLALKARFSTSSGGMSPIDSGASQLT